VRRKIAASELPPWPKNPYTNNYLQSVRQARTSFRKAPTQTASEFPQTFQSTESLWVDNFCCFPESCEKPAKARTVSGVRGNFVRAKISSITGGSGITVQVLD
jgi:hypothetical protein